MAESTWTTADALPLAGQTILVTRSATQAGQFSQLLQAQGAIVIDFPALTIGPPSSWQPLDQAIGQIADYQWLILTSSNGVDYFWQRLTAQGKTLADLSGLKIAVVGEKTAQQLGQYGRIADYVPPNFVADDLVACFPASEPLLNCRMLFPRVETGGREVLVQELTAKGAIVTEVPAYQSVCSEAIPTATWDALLQHRVQIVTFASSKTVQCFARLLAQNCSDWQTLLTGVGIASIGPQTSTACQTHLGRVDLEATVYTLDGLTAAIIAWVGQRRV